MSRRLSWHALCVQADPDLVRDSRVVDEYEFSTADGGSSPPNPNNKGGRRVFRADYQDRGPYADEAPAVWTPPPMVVRRRSTSWRHLVVYADTTFARSSTYVMEYEFTAIGMAKDDRANQGGYRVFWGNYQSRGPYATVTLGDNTLTWNGLALNWHAQPLTWTL